jgi:small-conductance mechanosensitive channel/CRP-like cAMP-binding protein
LLQLVVVGLLAFFFARDASAADPVKEASQSGLSAIVNELVRRWALIGLAAGLVAVAWLVNRVAPQKRKRIRRVAILFLLYLASFGISAAMYSTGMDVWGDRLHFVATLFAAYTAVNLIAVATFDLALPAARVNLVSITTDITVGVAYLVSTLMVLRAAGVNTGSVLTTSAVVSGFVALSLQNTLSNIFGGLALQLDDSIRVGDWILLENGRQGKVKEVRWRHTVLETRDWDTMVVPNSSLLSEKFTILGKREGAPLQHRMWVYFHVDFRYSPARVIAAVNEALQAAPIERVAAEPKAHCIVMDFAKDTRESFAYYAVRYWLTDIAVDDPTSSAVRGRIFHALRRAGIPLARPSSTMFVQLEDDETEKRRLSRHREQRMTALRAVDLFKSLKEDELKTIVDRLKYAPFTAGETITKQGSVAHWLYILAAGTAEIRARIEGVTKTVATLEAPSFFGEMGLMTGEPRTADVVAMGEVECFRLDKEAFEKIIKDRPEMARELSTTLAERRVELIAAREGLDAEAKRKRADDERTRILGKIQDFFGLGRNSLPR